jgi:type IV secretion system protein TrbI
MSQDEGMSPNVSPSSPARKTGGRRLNNVPVYIVGGVLTLFLIVMALVAADRAKQQNQPKYAKDETVGNTSMFAKEIVGQHMDGIIPPPASPLVPPSPETPPIPIVRGSNLDMPPTPPAAQQQGAKPNDELERIRQAKMQRLENAIKAKTNVQVTLASTTVTPDNTQDKLAVVRREYEQNRPRETDPTKAYKERMQYLQAGMAGGGGYGGAPRLLQEDEQPRQRAGYEQFANNEKGDRWRLDSEPDAPRTPYVLRTGYVLPAIMLYGINSALPGQIVGQVSQDVFDTATHRWKLIPQGSRLVGTYSSEVEYGQARVMVAWQRIVFPDGKAMDIGAMPGTDSEGYSGFTDQVNNHYVRLYGAAFLLSAVTAGFTLSQNQNQQNPGSSLGYQQNASTALSQSLGQQLGQVTARIMQKNLNISPTLEIRPGYRFNVVVTKDMTFSKPYESFDY